MIDLKATYRKRYRIGLDASATIPGQTREERLWLYQIRGKHGHVYVHGVNTLGAFTDKPNVGGKLRALEGVTIHQRGDRECSVTFPPERLEAVAKVLRLKRRRIASEAQRAVLVAARAKLRDLSTESTAPVQDAMASPGR